MRAHRRFGVLLFLFAALAGGCGSGDSPSGVRAEDEGATTGPDVVVEVGAPPSPAPLSEPSGTIVSNGGTYHVEYTPSPDPIPLNELFGIRVVVYQASDRSQPLGDVELAVDARMPDHRHGMNREPRVQRRDDGGFDVSGMLFHMPGLWELHFDITQDGMTERAEFDLDLE